VAGGETRPTRRPSLSRRADHRLDRRWWLRRFSLRGGLARLPAGCQSLLRDHLYGERLRASTTHPDHRASAVTPRVDPKQLRPPPGRTAVRTRASAQAPSPRAPAQARRDFGPGGHLICGRKCSPWSRQPRLTPARLPRRATGPLFGEVQTLGCPPRVTVAASATTPAPAPADAPQSAPAECTIRTNCKSLVLVTPSSWDRLIWHRAPAPRHGLCPPHFRPSYPPWLTTRDRWEFRSSDRPMH